MTSSRRAVWLFLLSLLVWPAAFGQAPLRAVDNAPLKRFERSFFGLHVLRPFQNKLWRESGHGTVRLHDLNVSWRDLEPQQGQWQWARLDDAVKLVVETQADIVLPLQTTPRWASSAPSLLGAYGDGASAPPADLANWDTYVSAVVQRYKGRIAYYEMWNEPNLKKFFSGEPKDLSELTVRASRIIRQLDPKAKVVCAGITGTYGLDWLAKYLAAGAGDACDIVGYHLYTSHKKPEVLVDLVTKIRKVQANTAGASKPLWNTESGWLIDHGVPIDAKSAGFDDNAKATSADQAIGFLVRTHLLARWLGVERFYWYAWDHPEMGLTLGRGVESTAVSRTYTTLAENLVDATLESCQRAKMYWVCSVAKGSNKDRYYWSEDVEVDGSAVWAGQLLVFDGDGRLKTTGNVEAGQRLKLTGRPVVIRSSAS